MQLRAVKLVWGWEHMPCKERLRELHTVERQPKSFLGLKGNTRLEREPKSFLPVPGIIKKMQKHSLLRCTAAG